MSEAALKKLSIGKVKQKKIRELVSNGVSGSEIAKIIGLSQSKAWRNMEIMGLNNKKVKAIKDDGKFFNIKEFERHYKF